MVSSVPGHRNPKSTPTIYDIAAAAGVSASTVSRALNVPGRIGAETEARIRATAQSMGYQLNPMARALPTGKTGTVALLLSDVTNPVYFDLIRGAERVSARQECTLVLAEFQESAESELAIARRLQVSVDGIVLVGSRLDDATIRGLAETKPLVLVNREVPQVASIVPDAASGLDAALDHLLDLGHTSIGYLSGPTSSWANNQRWTILLSRAIERGVNIVELAAGTPTMEGGRASLERVRASGVTGLIAYNDLMALGLMGACRDAGVEVPGQLSIVGFDDIFGSDLPTPALTTIRSPLTAAGELAVAALMDVDGPAPMLQTEFVRRASTGAPR